MDQGQILGGPGTLARRAALQREVQDALAMGAVRAVCQVVVSLSSGDELGYEALSRPQGRAPLDSPQGFLAAAAEVGLLKETDRAWRMASLARFGPEFPAGRHLLLNVSPASLLTGHTTASRLEAAVRESGLVPERVVLELTEGETIHDFDQMRRVLGGFRARGFLIAIDDAGAGQSSLQSIVELRPDFIKLDRWLARDIELDRSRRSMVEALVGFAHEVRAKVVAEGIETYEQLNAFISLGADFGQGYLFGKPGPNPREAPPEVRLHIGKFAAARRRETPKGVTSAVRDLAFVSPTVGATTPGERVFALFQENVQLEVVAVLGDHSVVGLITRGRIFERMAGQFGLALNGRRPARELCTPASTVQAVATAQAAARVALARPPSAQNEPLVVLDGPAYAGVVSMTDLLQQLLAAEVAEARLMSPLTGLPGNRLIKEQIESHRTEGEPRVLLYADIDDFKSFNDRFGFGHGDAAITGLASVLVEGADACSHGAFVGHVGGDDFVVIVHADDLAAFRRVVEERLGGRWFDPANRLALDRLTVSVGGGPLADARELPYEELGAVVAATKRILKRHGGNCFVVRLAWDGPDAGEEISQQVA